MKVSDPVHLYEGEWFNEGRITAITPEGVDVDFIDWVQRYEPSELQITYVFYRKIWVPTAPGIRIHDFCN